MAIVVICWVSVSLLFCLALLRSAARPRPIAGEQIAVEEVALKMPKRKKAHQGPGRLVTSSTTV